MPEIKIIKAIEEEYMIRLSKCIDYFTNSKEYIDILCAVVPLTRNSNNRDSMVSNIEELSKQYSDNPKRMLKELLSLGRSNIWMKKNY